MSSNITINTSVPSLFPNTTTETGANTASHTFQRTPKQKNYHPSLPAGDTAPAVNSYHNTGINRHIYTDTNLSMTNPLLAENMNNYNDYSWFDGHKIISSSLNSLGSWHNSNANNMNNSTTERSTNWWINLYADDDSNFPIHNGNPAFARSSTPPTTAAIDGNVLTMMDSPAATAVLSESSHDQWMLLQHEWANTKNRVIEENEFLIEQLERKKWGVWAMHAAESERQRRIQVLKDIELEQELERKIRRKWAVSQGVDIVACISRCTPPSGDYVMSYYIILYFIL
jgi:hypothetical protein